MKLGLICITKKHYGYSLKNTKCFITLPASRGKNISLFAAISSSRIVSYVIREAAFNGNTFIDFINNSLRPHFESNPRDVLVMDNVAFHHRTDVVELLNRLGIVHVFLPPYSPQFSPIEEFFSCLKARYTSIRPAPPNRAIVEERIRGLLETFNVSFDSWYDHMRIWVERGIARHEFH